MVKMVKNHDFSDVVAQYGATRFFTENPAVLGNSLYAPLSSCKKAKKSIVGKYDNFWTTNQPTNHKMSICSTSLKLRTTSDITQLKLRTKVEN